SPWFATSTAFPVGVLISASPVTSSGARKPLSTAGTGVKWPCPSPLSHKPLPASARGVFGSASYRLPATIRSRLPSPSTSSTAIPLIGEICARLGSDDRVRSEERRVGKEDRNVTGVQTCALPIFSTAGTGVKWPCPSPLSHKPLPASARGVFGSASYRLPATIRSRLPSPSTSSTAIPLIGEICARLGSDDRV